MKGYCLCCSFGLAFLSACNSESISPHTDMRLDAVNPTRGPISGGLPVSLWGDNFPQKVRVFFGDAQAEVLASGAQEIRVLSPAHSYGPVPVRVEASEGASVISVERKPVGYRYHRLEFSFLSTQTLEDVRCDKVLAGDVNGDGSDDIICEGPLTVGGTRGLGVLLGDGETHFSKPILAEPPPNFGGLADVCDWNGDGRADVILAETNHIVDSGWHSRSWLFLGQSDGVLRQEGLLSDWSKGPIAETAACADWDGDGHTDLALFGLDSRVLQGDGSKGVTGTVTSLKVDMPTSTLFFQKRDVDQDGRMDFVLAAGTSMWMVRWKEGQARIEQVQFEETTTGLLDAGGTDGGSFVLEVMSSTGIRNVWWTEDQGFASQRFFNFTGFDSFSMGQTPSLTSAKSLLQQPSVIFRSDELLCSLLFTWHFQPFSTPCIPIDLGQGTSATVLLANQDFFPDYLMLSNDLRPILILGGTQGFQGGTNALAGKVEPLESIGTIDPDGSNLRDLNHDGRVDWVRSNGVYLSDGERWSLHHKIDFRSFHQGPQDEMYHWSQAALEDFDGDGNQDLARLWTSDSDHEVWLFFGNGQGTFGEPVISRFGDREEGGGALLETCDLDGDGALDILVPSIGNDLYRGIGKGRFASPVTMIIPELSVDDRIEAAGDLDGNGRCDLVVGGPGSVKIVELGKDGVLAIRQVLTPILSPGFGSRLESIADVDGDGDLDLVLSVQSNTGLCSDLLENNVSIRVAFNEGIGHFSSPAEVLKLPGCRFSNRVRLADFDGDGLNDLLLQPSALDQAARSEGAFILPNQGDGRFSFPVPTYLPRIEYYPIDLNGDGLADLVPVGNMCSATVMMQSPGSPTGASLR